MPWVYLLVAGLLEVAWAVGLKSSQGFTKFWPSVVTVVAMAASLFFLDLAIRDLPLGTAYAVWTGIGAVGTVLVGVIAFGDSASAARLACVALIVAGIVGLKLVTPDPAPAP